MGNQISEYSKDDEFTLNNGNQFVDNVIDTILNLDMKTADGKGKIEKYNLKRICCLGKQKDNYEITVPIAVLENYKEFNDLIKNDDELKKYIQSFKTIKIDINNSKYKDQCSVNMLRDCENFYDREFCPAIYENNKKLFGFNNNVSYLHPPKNADDKKAYYDSNWASDCRCINSPYWKKSIDNGLPIIIQMIGEENKNSICDGENCYISTNDKGTCDDGYGNFKLRPYLTPVLVDEMKKPITIQKNICNIKNEIDVGKIQGNIGGNLANITSHCNGTINPSISNPVSPDTQVDNTKLTDQNNIIIIAVSAIIVLLLIVLGIYFFNKKKSN
jgi:hypothetical protein